MLESIKILRTLEATHSPVDSKEGPMLRERFLRTGMVWSMWVLGIVGSVGTAMASKKDNTLNIAWEKELETLDLYYNTAREGIIVSHLIYDTLFYRDPKTNEYLPLLATSYKWIDDTTMEIKLRTGVKFHNDEVFDADDVVFTINYVTNPDNKVLVQQNVAWMERAEKTDSTTVRIYLKRPFPAALEYLSNYVPIYPNEYYSKVGSKGFGAKPIGTGPYKVQQVEPGKSIVFVRNESYFKDGPKGYPSIEKIVQRTIPEVNTKLAELITGGLDWVWQVPPDQMEKLAKMPHLRVIPAETMRVGFLYMDASGRSGPNPFQKLEVRRALNHAIDREAMAKKLVGGQSRVIHTACFPTQFGCTDEGAMRYEYNPDKAKSLLAQAGYPDGFEVDLYAYRERPYAEAVVGYLKAVGIKANLQFMQYAAMRDKWHAGKASLGYWTWGSYSINDCSAITGYWFKFGPDDYARDEQVKEWLELADATVDPQKRKEYYGLALRRIAEQAYWVPLFSYVSNYAFHKDLEFEPHPDEVPRFYKAKWRF
jgi:peptide/nickel transport system substrate-binding protein